MINYLDRSALSVAAPFIQEDLNIRPAQMGMLFSSFSSDMPSLIYRRLGIRQIRSETYAVGCNGRMVGFSGAIALTYNFVSLFIIRVISAWGRSAVSGNEQVGQQLVSAKERARALGMTMCGTPLGGAVSGPIVGLIAIHWGWKASFVLIMIIGLVWTCFWMKFMKDKPADSGSLSPEKEARPKRIPASRCLLFEAADRAVYGVRVLSYNYICSFLNMVSELFNDSPGLSIHDMSVATIIPWVVGFLGLALGDLFQIICSS
ncbi:MFS transporter [Bacillus licheniformis]|nr:MFS transporter [Bacillus licheniformis]